MGNVLSTVFSNAIIFFIKVIFDVIQMLFKLNTDSEPCHMTSSSNVSVIFYTSEAYERDPVSKNKVDLI